MEVSEVKSETYHSIPQMILLRFVTYNVVCICFHNRVRSDLTTCFSNQDEPIFAWFV